MIKAFFKFVGYISLKWVCFYTYQFIESGNKLNWGEPTNKEGRFLAAFMLLALPLAEIIILVFPFQIAIRQKGWVTISILLFAFILEFLLGWYSTNQRLASWMIIKILISACLFFIIYRKQLHIIN